jgi:hypothetical protein
MAAPSAPALLGFTNRVYEKNSKKGPLKACLALFFSAPESIPRMEQGRMRQSTMAFSGMGLNRRNLKPVETGKAPP